MAIHDAGMFTVKGINRLKILQDAIDRNLHPGQAAEMLGITPRHCRRLLKRYRQLGPLGMNNQIAFKILFFPQYMFLNMVHNLFISGHGVT